MAMEFLINIADYCILVKFYREMLGKPRYQKRITWLGFSFVLVAGMTWLNHMNLPIVNIISSFVYLLAAGLWFESKMKNRILMAVFYWGIFMGADVLAVFFFRTAISENIGADSIVLLRIIYVLIMYFVVYIVCAKQKESRSDLPAGTTVVMAVVLFACATGCIFLNWGGLTGKYSYKGIVLLLLIFAVVYYLIFMLIEKMNRMIKINYENERLLQEIQWKEAHFQELEKVNQKVLRIRHDMKNRLNAIAELNDLEAMRESIRLMCGEVSEQNEKIYTGNQIVNGICKMKFEQAKQQGILIEQHINISSHLKMESGEIGILIGNILDNAIEASQKCENKYIRFRMEMRANNLLISMENSKRREEKGGIGTSTKKDGKAHGYGMVSVKNIVDKYSGSLRMMDEGESYRTEMILYHVI